MVGAWVRLLVNSAVVAAVAVAAQLGAGDALGILDWQGPHDSRAWSTLLTWVAFSYAVAVLAGAMVGRLAVRRHAGGEGVGSRITASIVAAGGAAATIGLAWLPSQSLTPPTNVNPGLVVSLTAGAGVVAGLVLALAALAARPIAVGLQAMAAWLWLLGIASAATELASADRTGGTADAAAVPAPRLGVPDAPSVIADSAWMGPRVLIIAAVVIGLAVPGIALWRGAGRVGAALSGLGGPALAAAAYLIAAPGERGGAQADAYVNAMLAVTGGLAASVLVAMPWRRRTRPMRAVEPVQEAPLEGDILEVVRAAASPVSAEGRARPSWAEGSGPFARAYTSAARPASATAGTGIYRSAATEDSRPTGRHAALD